MRRKLGRLNYYLKRRGRNLRIVLAMPLKSLNRSVSDAQLFRGIVMVSRWVGLPENPTIIPLVLYFYSI